MSSMRMRALGAIALASAFTAASSTPAAAVDAVPGEVVQYIAADLVDDLNEFYGPNADNEGVLFTPSTTTTPAIRVFGFTEQFLAGVEGEPEVRRLNEWTTVIAIDEEVVGFALVSIDPVTVSPQLTAFVAGPDLGTTLAALPETATLVRDDARSAWFSLEEGMLSPLLAGTSHVSEPISLADYREVLADLPSDTSDEDPVGFAVPSGLLLAVLVLALVGLLLAVEAFLPYWRARSTAAGVEEGEEMQADGAEAEAEPAPTARKKPVASD